MLAFRISHVELGLVSPTVLLPAPSFPSSTSYFAALRHASRTVDKRKERWLTRTVGLDATQEHGCRPTCRLLWDTGWYCRFGRIPPVHGQGLLFVKSVLFVDALDV